MFIMSNFVKEVVARLKGDDAEKVAAQNERKAVSAFKQQISSLESQLVDDEVAVEEAIEAYNNAAYPTRKIENNELYLRGIISAKERLDAVQQELDTTKASIEFFKSEQSKIFKK